MDTNTPTTARELSPRQIALRDFETAYEGKPCTKCNGTRRYTKSSACAACMIRGVVAKRKRWAAAKKDWAAEKRRRDAERAEAAAKALLLQAPTWMPDL